MSLIFFNENGIEIPKKFGSFFYFSCEKLIPFDNLY